MNYLLSSRIGRACPPTVRQSDPAPDPPSFVIPVDASLRNRWALEAHRERLNALLAIPHASRSSAQAREIRIIGSFGSTVLTPAQRRRGMQLRYKIETGQRKGSAHDRAKRDKLLFCDKMLRRLAQEAKGPFAIVLSFIPQPTIARWLSASFGCNRSIPHHALGVLLGIDSRSADMPQPWAPPWRRLASRQTFDAECVASGLDQARIELLMSTAAFQNCGTAGWVQLAVAAAAGGRTKLAHDVAQRQSISAAALPLTCEMGDGHALTFRNVLRDLGPRAGDPREPVTVAYRALAKLLSSAKPPKRKYGGHLHEGGWQDNKPHGPGIRYLDGDKIHYGCWRDGVAVGWSICIQPKNYLWEGEYAGSLGFGILTSFDSNRTWRGEFCVGPKEFFATAHGYCFQRQGGVETFGEFRRGLQNGYARTTYAPGSVHLWQEGDYLNGTAHGWCRKLDIDIWYEGQVESNKACGWGRSLHGDEFYEGFTVAANRQGQGRVIYADGAVYGGSFAAQKPHGFGVFVAPSGARTSGQWNQGKPDKRAVFTPAQTRSPALSHLSLAQQMQSYLGVHFYRLAEQSLDKAAHAVMWQTIAAMQRCQPHPVLLLQMQSPQLAQSLWELSRQCGDAPRGCHILSVVFCDDHLVSGWAGREAWALFYLSKMPATDVAALAACMRDAACRSFLLARCASSDLEEKLTWLTIMARGFATLPALTYDGVPWPIEPMGRAVLRHAVRADIVTDAAAAQTVCETLEAIAAMKWLHADMLVLASSVAAAPRLTLKSILSELRGWTPSTVSKANALQPLPYGQLPMKNLTTRMEMIHAVSHDLPAHVSGALWHLIKFQPDDKLEDIEQKLKQVPPDVFADLATASASVTRAVLRQHLLE